ncbi:hypothetical protein B0G52_123117 [Cohnella sp. SGD-V74]|nr:MULTISPECIES: hypothetical protein [unclassified Cohnella]PRX62481.1 hypothetical protein B0G52_123117 [Cohnella sp. SGD-V74]
MKADEMGRTDKDDEKIRWTRHWAGEADGAMSGGDEGDAAG